MQMIPANLQALMAQSGVDWESGNAEESLLEVESRVWCRVLAAHRASVYRATTLQAP